MVALTQDRNTPRREGVDYSDPMAANVTIFIGSIVCLNAAGNAVPGAAATTLRARGVAQERKVNGATVGAETIRSWPGVYRFANSAAGDAIARADIGATAWIVDDQTVAKTNGANTRSAAGPIMDVDASGVWVRIG